MDEKEDAAKAHCDIDKQHLQAFRFNNRLWGFEE
jgi:hypothetical protein